MTRETAILLTLVAYNAAMVWLGFVAERRTKDGTDYFLGGRRLGPIVASFAASASSSSAWTLLGVSGYACKNGLAALWLFPGCVGGFLLNWYLLAPALQAFSHRTQALTATEALVTHLDKTRRRAIVQLASLIVLASLLAYVASQFQAAGKSFREAFAMSETTSILLGAGVVVVYTLLGGFWAVSLTDCVQGLLMMGAAIVVPVGAFVALGPSGLADGLRGVEQTGYLSLTAGMGPAAGLGLMLGLLGIGLGYPGQPHVVNKFMAMRQGGRNIVIARRAAIAWAACIYAGMILLGLCARVLYPHLVRTPGGEESALMVAATELFSPVIAGLVIAAVLSAIMSTVDSQLLVAASTVTYDLGLGGATHQNLLARSRVVVLLLSTGAVVTALAVDESIFRLVLFAWSSMGSAFGPLLLVTVLLGPVSRVATLWSMSLGFTLSAGAYVAGKLGLLGALAGWGGALERVLPFVVALAVALRGRR